MAPPKTTARRIDETYRAGVRLADKLASGANPSRERDDLVRDIRRKLEALYKLQNQTDVGSADYAAASDAIGALTAMLPTAAFQNQQNYVAKLDSEASGMRVSERDWQRSRPR